ncbi:MAG: hypothetical protein R6U04_07460 [Bacteroidales bacterium]
METSNHKTIKGTQFWLPLDNAAKIFPATINKDVTTVFRLSVILKNPVKINPLMKAISMAEERFPYYKVRLSRGFFWYYLEHIKRQLAIEVDNKRPCRRFPENKLLMRILVKENRISVECSHILTDGGGVFEFIKTLLALYSRECGVNIPDNFNFMHPNDPIKEEEYEDAYKRYFKEKIPSIIKKSKAFHLPFDLNPSPRFKTINITVSINEIKQKAKERGITITDYLVAVYLYTLQEIHEEQSTFSRSKKNKQIRIQVPVNLRKIFPSQTMRNFSLFVMPEIDLRLGHYTFDEISRRVYHQIRLETDEKLISKNISRNVGSEKKIYVKSIPLFIKSLILKAKYYSLGTSQYSGVLTNLGLVKLPAGIEAMIDHFIITAPPPNKMLKVNCGVIGFNDKLVLSFGNITKSKMLENKVIEFLKSQDINATIEEDNVKH